MPHFQAHEHPPPSSLSVSESSFVTCHVSKLTSLLLSLPPLQMVSPRFATCHISKLTNLFLPLPPLQKVSPHFQCATFLSSPTHLSHTFSPPASESSFCTMPRFQAHQPTPPSSSPPASESLFCNMPRFRAHQPAPPSSSPPASESPFCNVPHFRAH